MILLESPAKAFDPTAKFISQMNQKTYKKFSLSMPETQIENAHCRVQEVKEGRRRRNPWEKRRKKSKGN